MKGFDCDGVITIGLYPGPNDIIITGRSYEEMPETIKMLDKMGIRNPVYFNPLKFSEKTRVLSSKHKIKILKKFPEIKIFFEDDPITFQVLQQQHLLYVIFQSVDE